MSSPSAPQRPVALVTGASRGIGRAIAIELARTHRVIGTYRTREDEAATLKQVCGAELVRLDISSSHDREALVSFCRRNCDHVDLLVNNAGMAPKSRADLLEATEESFDEV